MPLQILREQPPCRKAPPAAPLPPMTGFQVESSWGSLLRFRQAEIRSPAMYAETKDADESTWGPSVRLELSDVEQLRDALNDWLEQERGRSIFVPKDKHHPDYTLPAPETESVEDFIARGRSSNAERLRAAFEGPLPGLFADPELYIERKERRS